MITFLFGLLLQSSWFFSKKKKQTNEKVLVSILSGRVDTTDPTRVAKKYPAMIIGSVADTMLSYEYTNDKLKIQTKLLKAMPSVSKNGLVYTFELKPGIYFQDHPRLEGKKRELTSKEVVFSITQHMKKGAHYYELFSPICGAEEFNQGNADHVTGIKSLGKYTVQITLKNPYSNLLYILAMPTSCIMAPESLGNGKASDFQLIGTGPYVIEKMDAMQVVLKKNPTYREERFPKVKSPKFNAMKASEGKLLPFIDKLVFKIIPEFTTQMTLVKTGQVDVMPVLTNDECANVLDGQKALRPELKAKGMEVFPIPGLGLRFFPFNVSHPVFKKYPFLCKVIAMGFDAEYALKEIAHGYAKLTKGLVPPGIPGHEANLKNPYAYNLEEAKNLLQKNGFKLKKNQWYKGKEKLPTIVFTIAQGNADYAKLADFLKNSLRKIHVNLEIKPMAWDELMNKSKIPGNNIMMYTFGWALDVPSASDTLQFGYSKNIGSLNPFHYTDPVYDNWFEKTVTLDPNSKECIALFKKMNRRLYNQPVGIFLWSNESYSMFYAYVKNYRYSDLMYDTFKYMDIDLKEKAKGKR
ncbi:MAG: ABC transporter substrate-binding protein [Bacteroidota bacterium]